MAKYVILVASAYGHVNPTLAVAQELVRRGEQVVYYLTEEFRTSVEATGAAFQPYQSARGKMQRPGGLPKDSNLVFRAIPLMRIKESQNILPQVLERISMEQADFILYDSLCLWGRIVAQRLHLPAILLYPTYPPNERSRFMWTQPEFMQSEASGMFDDIQSALNDLCTLYHVPLIDYRDFFTHVEALNIVFMPRAFHPAGETFDEHFVFVGPSIAPRKDAPALPLDHTNDQPVLYISLGTAFNNRPDFFNLCLQIFGHQPWQVVMAHGKRVDEAVLGSVPPNFLLAPYVPQLEVLQQASVFVTHGGMNSMMESLYFGVPMVVVPQMIEQEMNARRCAALGLGVALDPNNLTAETLSAAVEQVHHMPGFRERVKATQQIVREAGGYQRAADAICNFARSQK